MNALEFRRHRLAMGKSQRQLAQLLGISSRAVQSFEQEWRRIPVHVERHLLFLVALALRRDRAKLQCWTLRQCPEDQRSRCPAWELDAGDLCWFINGTICHGQAQKTWDSKMAVCRRCEVFVTAFGIPVGRGKVRDSSARVERRKGRSGTGT